MTDRRYNVLFLCTGNSARSIMAEALVNYWGKDRFQGFSAGSHPKPEVHPLALEILKRNRVPVNNLHAKSWDEFVGPGAPSFDFVFTVLRSRRRSGAVSDMAGTTHDGTLGHRRPGGR